MSINTRVDKKLQSIHWMNCHTLVKKKEVDLDVLTQKLLSKNKKQAVALDIDVKTTLLHFFFFYNEKVGLYNSFLKEEREEKDRATAAAPG